MPRLELFPFRFRDPVSGKWVRARYVAQREEIAARYAEWEIAGPPEIRDVDAPGVAVGAAEQENEQEGGLHAARTAGRAIHIVTR